MAAGSATWGALATRFGPGSAMLAAAIVLVAGLLASRRFRLEAAQIDVAAVVEA
jgi:hypothetical protein